MTPPPIASGESGLVIACELPCIQCGYNLNTLKLSGRCPECGSACSEAMSWLGMATAEEIHRIEDGLVLVSVMAIGGPSAAVVLGAVSAFATGSIAGGACVLAAFALIVPGLTAKGIKRLSEPVPARYTGKPIAHEEVVSRRVRTSAVVHCVLLILFFAFATVSTMTPGRGDSLTALVIILLLVTLAAWTVRNMLILKWLGMLMRRAHAPRSVQMLRTSAWISAGLFVLFAMVIGAGTLHATVSLGRAASQSLWESLETIVNTLFWGVLPGWQVGWAVLLLLVARRLKAVRREIETRGPVVVAPRTQQMR